MIPDRRALILIVDDSEENIDILINGFEDEYELCVALSGNEGLEVLSYEKPDLILLDIIMPEMNGYEVCQRIKSNDLTKEIPILFLTGINDIESKKKAFEFGIADYITKPFEMPEVKARVKAHLELGFARTYLENQNDILEKTIEERTYELEQTRAATIASLAALAETRDPETGAHIKRTQKYVHELAQYLQKNSVYGDQITKETLKLLYECAPLHDMGKVGVKDEILLKPDRLTSREFEEIKLHTIYGYNALKAAQKGLGENSFLHYASEIAYCHHEKWDGSGYPRGLIGDAIPLSGRLMAIADVYDALINKRVYKASMSHEKAREIILEGKGTHFDPIIVDAFIVLQTTFKEIAQKYRDNE